MVHGRGSSQLDAASVSSRSHRRWTYSVVQDFDFTVGAAEDDYFPGLTLIPPATSR